MVDKAPPAEVMSAVFNTDSAPCAFDLIERAKCTCIKPKSCSGALPRYGDALRRGISGGTLRQLSNRVLRSDSRHAQQVADGQCGAGGAHCTCLSTEPVRVQICSQDALDTNLLNCADMSGQPNGEVNAVIPGCMQL